MKEILLVAMGGMFGSVSRYLCSGYVANLFLNSKFPFGTFTVNIIGCLLIGIIAGITEKISGYNAELRLLLISGFLGGFTTFSAFGIESLHLIKDGNLPTAFAYITGSVSLGIIAAYLGLRIIS